MPTQQLAPDASEPLGTWSAPLRSEIGARRLAFELSSRGDRVAGELWLPAEGRGPFALVLQQGAGGAREAEAAVAPWIAAGLAAASIDLPLHGARASAKLSALALAGLRSGAAADALARDLGEELARQAVLDLRRCLDALPGLSLPGLARLDARRVAYAGAGLAAALGPRLCAQDPRLRAAVLAGAAGWLPAEDDPAAAAGGSSAALRRVEADAPLAAAASRAFVARALGLAPR